MKRTRPTHPLRTMNKRYILRFGSAAAAALFLLCSCNSGKFSDLKKESDPLVLPVLRIETEEGKEVADRENYLPMTLSVSGSAAREKEGSSSRISFSASCMMVR